MNFSDKTFETLGTFERYFKTACEADWCPNPGRAALEIMADALSEKDGRRTFINHACGSCILNVVKRAGYLYFEDKAQREASAAPETPKPTKTPAKKKTAATAKKTAKK